MKKLYIFFAALFALFVNTGELSAQCTPDPAIGGKYIYPDKLPFATANVSYSQVLTFRIPLDTDVVSGPITAHIHIDSAELAGIIGIPQGFGYQCNHAGCVWPGGSQGCALLSGYGDSTKIGDYPMRVYVISYIRVGSTAPYTYTTKVDSSDYTFRIQAAAGIFEITPVINLSAWPNPVSNTLNIALTDINGSNNVLEVFDMAGKKVFVKQFERPSSYSNTEKIDMTGFPKGLYTVVLRQDGRTAMKKVLKD